MWHCNQGSTTTIFDIFHLRIDADIFPWYFVLSNYIYLIPISLVYLLREYILRRETAACTWSLVLGADLGLGWELTLWHNKVRRFSEIKTGFLMCNTNITTAIYSPENVVDNVKQVAFLSQSLFEGTFQEVLQQKHYWGGHSDILSSPQACFIAHFWWCKSYIPTQDNSKSRILKLKAIFNNLISTWRKLSMQLIAWSSRIRYIAGTHRSVYSLPKSLGDWRRRVKI